MEEERTFHRLMRELCTEMGIKLESLSYGWILQLSKNGKVRHITGTRFDINPEATGNIACDKYATYEVLKSQGVPVIEHTMLFNPAMREEYILDDGISKLIVSTFSKFGRVVVKPNNGCDGKGVTLCTTLKETEVAAQKLFANNNGSISICPYYDIKKEYRTFYLNGEVLLVYSKTRPFVIGDGKSTLGTLIKQVDVPNKDIAQENLKNLDMEYVPCQGEKVNISWKHNLCGGAIPTVLEDGHLRTQIENLAVNAGKAMNINFATIDIIQTNSDELYVLEVNSGIGTTIFTKLVDGGYEMVKDIYRSALKSMF